MTEARQTAIGYHNRALALAGTDPKMAYRHACSAVTVDPTLADGWAYLGAVLADLGSLPASIASFRRALACPEGDAPGDLNLTLKHRCLVQLGHRLIDNRVVTPERLHEAADATNAALLISGVPTEGTAFAHTNLSVIHGLWDNRVAACWHALKGFGLCPEPATELGLAFALLFDGHYADGLRHFEARFPHVLPDYLKLPWPRWDGKAVGTLLVLCEQGLGDTVSMARFLSMATFVARKVLFQVQPELLRLMTAWFASYPNVEVVPQEHLLPEVDAWCPLFSLPVPMGRTDAEIAGSVWTKAAPPAGNTSWKRPGARKHVAIAWAGAPHNAIDPHRSIPFEAMLPLGDVPGVALYSVQVGDRARELHDKGAAALVTDLSPWIRDAYDTAAILGEMDAVVCCESFVGHLAGALDVRTLLLCSWLGRDWRSAPVLDGKTLWYPRTEVIRQGEDCDWGPVLAEVARRLSS